jgi:rare lipoprotein A
VEPRAKEPAARADSGCSAAELSATARQKLLGLATYYSDSLAGNSTASGEPYDPDRLTAAHRSLPFGTRVRVRRADTRSPPVCVTVNDRGPFSGKNRIIDLSRRGAEALLIIRLGVAPVQVDVL